MTILHLCSSYPYTSLYRSLLKELDNKKIEQIMYVPLISTHITDKRMLDCPKYTRYIFTNPYNNFDRFLYYKKLTKIHRDIKKNVDMYNIDLVHAHFLFSNGGVAYRLKQELGIEYIVAVRNTDVNYFFKYGIHLRKFGVKILNEAKKVIFLSPEYKEYVIEKYVPDKLASEINEKSYVIPNGVDDFWLDNLNSQKVRHRSSGINLIYVGELNKNKNIYNSIKAAALLKDRGFNVKFDIVGDGPLKKKIQGLIKDTNSQNDFILHGYINNKERLMHLYRKADIFVMPSLTETFGLVYIEAMSQGLPVIYSKGQGIDGYFEDGMVGYSVLPEKIDDIAFKIEKIIENYDNILPNFFSILSDFKWNKIADKYIEFYDM